jgi:hypothetical protein
VSELGPPATEVVPSWVDAPTVAGDHVVGQVITVDHFGNLITTIDAALLARFARPVVHVSSHRIPLARTYADVRPGEYLALVNAFGVLEVARAEQSAADGLGVERGAPVTVREGER